MATPEGKVKALIKRKLEAAGVYYFMPATHGYGRSGVPDFICCVRGRFLGIEAKAGRGKTTVLQDRELARINDAFGVALVVSDDEESQSELDLLLKSLSIFPQ